MKRAIRIILTCLILVALGVAILIVRRYIPIIGPGDAKVELGVLILKSVSELFKVTVLELPVMSDPSHPTVFRKFKRCVTDIFCAGNYWSVLDWRAMVRMSYNLATISPSYDPWAPPLTKVTSHVWKICLPPVAVDVELQAENVNFRVRRVGYLFSVEEAAQWEQELFRATRKYLGECFAQDASLRNRAQDVLKTKLDYALLPLRSEYSVNVNYGFADDPGERLCPRSFQRATREGEVSSEGLYSLPPCEQLLKALHAQ